MPAKFGLSGKKLRAAAAVLICAAVLLPRRAAVPAGRAPLRFAWLSDLHVGSDRGAADLQASVADINTLPGLAFVLVTGDITDMGSYGNLRQAKDILDGLARPLSHHPRQSRHEVVGIGRLGFRAALGRRPFRFRERRLPLHRALPGAGPEDGRRELGAPGRPLARGPARGQERGGQADHLRQPLSARPEHLQLVRRPRQAEDRSPRSPCSSGTAIRTRPWISRAFGGSWAGPTWARRTSASGYTIVEIGAKAMTFAERTAGKTLPTWHRIELEKGGLPVVAAGRSRRPAPARIRGPRPGPISASTPSIRRSGSAGASTPAGRSPPPPRSPARRSFSATPRAPSGPCASPTAASPGSSRRTIRSTRRPTSAAAGSSSAAPTGRSTPWTPGPGRSSGRS